ncbi:uncharacterized protein LOC129612318 [Condylostylus longicornis]|uniref:uncharacterized protein LOC129612318 n=1 Tax=Condylostylus longicornis TaxID=2530218 RepID=UPI00244DD03D|nr:uncharacterized protein LOC129612318 [Condylostylus longicornis]
MQKNINQDMEAIYNWMCVHKLSVNVSKTKYMLINSKSSEIYIKFNGNKINKVKEYRYLGVTVDEDLNWNQHVNETISKTRKIAGLFKKLEHQLMKYTRNTTS